MSSSENLKLLLFSLNISKNIIGSFILFVPWTFAKTGIMLGNIQILIVYFISVYSFCLIGHLVQTTNGKTYSDMFKAFGAWAVWFVDIYIIFGSICFNAGYIIFMKKRIVSIIFAYTRYNFPGWAVALIITIPIIYPLTMAKSLSAFRFISAATFGGLILLVVGVIALSVVADIPDAKYNVFPANFFGFVTAFSILSGNFDCHANAPYFYLEYQNERKDADNKKYYCLVAFAFFVVMVITSIFASVCFTTIGNGISDDALSDFPHSIWITLMTSVIIFSLIISYAQFSNSLKVSLHSVIYHKIMKQETPMTTMQNIILTTGLVSATLAIAIPLVEIGYFNAIVWALTGSGLVFIFPTALAIKIKALDGYGVFWKAFNIFVLAFGIVVSFGLGLGIGVYDWAQASATK